MYLSPFGQITEEVGRDHQDGLDQDPGGLMLS